MKSVASDWIKAPGPLQGAAPGLLRHLDITILLHHDGSVRTTITLDSDVDQMLKAEMRRSGATFRQAVNQAIRRGLADSGVVERKAFRLRPRRLSLRQGIDPAMLQHFEEDLEIETFLRKTRKLAKK